MSNARRPGRRGRRTGLDRVLSLGHGDRCSNVCLSTTMSFLKLPSTRLGFTRVPSSASLEEEDRDPDVPLLDRPRHPPSDVLPSAFTRPLRPIASLAGSSSRSLALFLLAQIALLFVGYLALSGPPAGPPFPPPPGSLLPPHQKYGPSRGDLHEWERLYGGEPASPREGPPPGMPAPSSSSSVGYDEVCQGGFGREMCEYYG